MAFLVSWARFLVGLAFALCIGYAATVGWSLSPAERHRTRAAAALREADCVALDVDSTVITSEGVDELAACLGKGEEVARLTRAAMEGDVSYEKSLRDVAGDRLGVARRRRVEHAHRHLHG